METKEQLFEKLEELAKEIEEAHKRVVASSPVRQFNQEVSIPTEKQFAEFCAAVEDEEYVLAKRLEIIDKINKAQR